MFTGDPAAISHASPTPPALYPALARTLWQWLALGALLLVFPAVRGAGLGFGPGALWLLAAPLSSLLVFHRHAIAAAWRLFPVPALRRHRPMTRAPQAIDAGRDSVRFRFREARHATKQDSVAGGRPARRKRRSDREISRDANPSNCRKKAP